MRAYLHKSKKTHFNLKSFLFVLLIFLLMAQAGMSQDCPPDEQPSCPKVTSVDYTSIGNGDGTVTFTVNIHWEQGTANNASLEWEVYLNTPICPESNDFNTTNCIPVNSSNSSGTLVEVIVGFPTDIIYVSASGRTNASCGGNYCNQIITQAQPVLPVKWLSLEAEHMDGKNQIRWETAQNINVSHFEIQKSHNGVSWEKLGSLQEIEDRLSVYKYEYTDTNPYSVSYYRIKEVDLDQAFSYSKITSVRFEAKNLDFGVFPNPAVKGQYIQLQGVDELDNYVIQVFDGVGKLQFTASDVREIQTNSLPKGIYFIRCQSATQEKTIKLYLQ